MAFLLSIIGCIGYVVLTTIAMFFYGGGSETDIDDLLNYVLFQSLLNPILNPSYLHEPNESLFFSH